MLPSPIKAPFKHGFREFRRRATTAGKFYDKLSLLHIFLINYGVRIMSSYGAGDHTIYLYVFKFAD